MCCSCFLLFLRLCTARPRNGEFRFSMHDAMTGDIIWGRTYDGDAERGMVFDEFTSKEHEILTGTITHIEPKNGSVTR